MTGQELPVGGRPSAALLRKRFFWRLYVTGLAVLSLVSINFFIPGSTIKCVQCDSSKSGECFENPPPARPCEKDMKFCQTTKETLNNGTVLSVIRQCVTTDTGSSCTPNTLDDIVSTTPSTCHWTCNTDGCNSGNKGRASLLIVAGLSSAILLFFSSRSYWT